jgi:signal transduction histidine kinase
MSVYHEDVAGIFPQDNILKDLSIEGYVGTPLIGSDNEVIGVLLALFQRPIEDDLLSKEILQIFAGRIAAEIERANYQNELISLNKTLEKRIQDRTSELQNINTELKDFAYIVSHDLKAPLRGISQLSEWIRTDIEDKLESENIEMFDLLQSRIKKMYTLIDGVLDYSRVGRIEEQAEAIDLNKLIQEIFDLVKDERNSEIKINHVLPVIKADKTRISQIYQNLISNAFKYNDKKEVLLNVGYTEDSDYHYFSVEDNGVGIDEKYFKKIFNIFQTIDGNNEDSSGIGLSIAKKIVEFYGGSISLESEISKGSKFSFSISKSKVKL